jgi:hypothetical protein
MLISSQVVTVKALNYKAIAILSLLVFAFFLGFSFSAQTATITIEPNSFQTEASYVVFTDGTTVKARNGTTGQIDYSGTDAASVIQSAINALKSGGTVFVKAGKYIISQTIVLKKGVNLVGEGKTRIWYETGTRLYGAKGANLTCILTGENGQIENQMIKDLSLIGYAKYGLYLPNGSSTSQIDISVGMGRDYTIDTGIYLDAPGGASAWTTVSGWASGVNTGVYINNEHVHVKDFLVAYPATYGFYLGSRVCDVILEDTFVSDERTSPPYVSATGYYIAQSRHKILIRPMSELYNPDAIHIQGPAAYNPAAQDDVVPIIDPYFYGGAKIVNPQRLFIIRTGMVIFPINALGASYTGVWFRRSNGDETPYPAVFLDESEHLWLENPINTKNAIQLGRWGSSQIKFLGVFLFKDENAVIRLEVTDTGVLYINRTISTSQKGVNVPVDVGVTNMTVTLPIAEPDTAYGVLVSPGWNTTYWITGKTTTSFTVNFGTAPTAASTFDWFLFR